ncbi:MAG: MFS transporter [Chloroflexi bacterium]|nr:MFS transporter [Chloroflexota bacterium]
MFKTSSIPAFAVLQNRDFRILWVGRAIHEVSRRMELLVLGYLIYQMTSSVFQVGLIAVCLNLPRPFVSPFAGVWADRLDRRRIMVGVHATFFGIGIVLLGLLITEAIQPWHVFVAAFLQGSAKVLDDPSRRTAIADLAGSQHLASAMSLETITNNSGKILGPLAGGALVAGPGFVVAYGILAALDLVVLLLMLRLRLPPRAPASGAKIAVLPSLLEGMRHAISNRMVLGVLCISLIMNALVLPIQYFIPVIASELLSVGPTLGGLLGSAEGIGTLIGASIIALKRQIRYHGRLFIAGALITALGVTLVAWSPWFLVSFCLLLLAGVGQAGFSTMQSTILLLSSVREIRGRTMGAQGTVNGLGHLVGDYEIAAVASLFGIGLAIGLNAGVGLLLILPVTLLTPLIFRQVGSRPENASPAEEALPSLPQASEGRG